MIGYLIHTFPGFSSTFLVEEIQTVRSMGTQIALFSLHVPKPSERPRNFDCYANETKALFPFSPWQLIKSHSISICKNPLGYLNSFGMCALGEPNLSLKDRVRTLFHWVEAPILASMLRSQGISHVHVHFLLGAASVMLFVNRMHGIPYSLTAHGSDIFVERVMQRKKILNAAFTRVMTEYNKNALLAILRPQERTKTSLRLVPLGVDIPAEPKFQAPSSGPFLFFHVGRMVWQKAQHLLLEACHILQTEGHSFQLLFVGDGELQTQLLQQIENLNLKETVKMLGALPKQNIMELYTTTHCFVMSSVSEGSPVVLMEAMSQGQPVIAPKLNGIPEMFTHGKDGWLFDKGDSKALAAVMRLAITERTSLEGMGKNAYENAKTQFDLNANTRLFRQDLLDCLS